MRSRPLVALTATFVLALSASACGGEDESAGPAPVVPTQPATAAPEVATPEATPDVPDPSTSTSGAGRAPGSDEPSEANGLSGGQAPPSRGTDADPIPEVAAKNADLTNFMTALGASGLDTSLEASGPFTVFAPNNDGFAKLGTQLDALLAPAAKAQLVNILSFHIVKGDVRVKSLKDGDLLTTLQGTRLRVTRSGSDISIGNSLSQARLVSTDIDAGNGVIHAIDTVLTPKPPS